MDRQRVCLCFERHSRNRPGGKRREYLVGFAVSSASPALAAVATNPIEVVKVRQQMQTIQNA